MRVSVIIPAFNGERTIGNTLESLVAERDSETEVVVIDDASEDRTGRIAAEFDILYHRLTVRSGPSVARNRGARLAQGDILLFIDADVMVQPGWLNSIRSGFASPEINAMQGIYTAAEPGTDLFTAYQNDYYHFYYSRISRADTMIASTFCFAIRRERFLAHGGFDESVSEPTVEDEEFGYRLAGQGCLVRLNKQLAVTHLAHYDAVSFTHRKIRMTRSQMSAMCRRKLDKLVTSVTNLCPGMTHHHLPVLLSLPLTPLLLLSVLLLPFGPPPALLAFVLSAAAFTAVNVDFWAFFIRRHGVSRLPALVLVTIYDRVLILVGFTLGLAEFCRRGKR